MLHRHPALRGKLAAFLLFASLCFAAPSAASGPTATTARVIDCNQRAFSTTVITSARGLRCRTAARVLLRHRGSISYRFRIRGGWSCRRVSGVELGGQWRCRRRGGKAFRFDFAD